MMCRQGPVTDIAILLRHKRAREIAKTRRPCHTIEPSARQLAKAFKEIEALGSNVVAWQNPAKGAGESALDRAFVTKRRTIGPSI
jgi:hypothetical protein